MSFGEPRVFERETLTTKPSTEDKMTGHLIGYTGHCPSMREAIGQRFGVATQDALYEKSRNANWFSDQAKQTTTEVSRHELPKQLGSTRDTTVTMHANELDSKGRSVFTGTKMPGYSGFTPGARSEYGKTHGAMHRAIDKDADGAAAAMSTGRGGASPGTSIGTTADRAVWSDRSPRTPRVVTVADRQLPGCEFGPNGSPSIFLSNCPDKLHELMWPQTQAILPSTRAREAKSSRPRLTVPNMSRRRRSRCRFLRVIIGRSDPTTSLR